MTTHRSRGSSRHTRGVETVAPVRPAAVAAELAANPAFLLATVEQVAHPIFVKDTEFRFVLVNRALCDLVGRQKADLLGRTDYDFFPLEEAKAFRATDSEVLRTGETMSVETETITDARGRRHVLTTTKAALRSESGEITHVVGVINDITRLKDAEEALKQANESLEKRVNDRTAALAAAQEELVRRERLALLGQLAGGLAHQIRNPLGAIANAACLLREDPAITREVQVAQLIDIVFEEVWKANQTITALLEYAKERPVRRRACAPWSIVSEALACRPLPSAIRVVDAAPALPLIEVDPDQVREALANIIQNALEAMLTGGTLTLSGSCDDGHVIIGIQDTGTGIDEELAAQLFRPLVTTKPSGCGLGLSTAQLLIKAQKGSVSFRSTPGQGTRFEVRLPIAGQACGASIGQSGECSR